MKPVFAVWVAVLLLTAGFVAKAQDAPAPAADVPGLGEIMTLQQLRHIKLWFAGRAGNWPLADYELGELNEGFEDIAKLLGGDTVDKMVGTPMKTLQKAVGERHRAAFFTAYDSLSAGCNNCHRTLDHAFIAIQRPTALPYTDQKFTPPK